MEMEIQIQNENALQYELQSPTMQGAIDPPKKRKERKMPPPRKKRPPSAADKKNQTVYPPVGVAHSLGKFNTVTLTQAVRCWAEVMETQGRELAEKFNAGEWNFMARACAGQEESVDPLWKNPWEHIAQMCERAKIQEIGLECFPEGKPAKAQAEALIKKVRALDYVQAWGVLTALIFRVDAVLSGKDVAGQEWWGLAYRRANAYTGLPEEEEAK